MYMCGRDKRTAVWFISHNVINDGHYESYRPLSLETFNLHEDEKAWLLKRQGKVTLL